jgi:LysM repeat protein
MVLFTAPALPADVLALPALPAASTATVRTSTTAPNGWTEYRVKGGDTLIGLAAIFRTTPGELATQNGLSNPRTLRAGQTILVPRGGAAPAAASPATAAPAAAAPTGGTAYTVKNGDTLWAIANAHGTTVPAILKANGLTAGAHIHPGQALTIGGAPAPAQVAAAKPAPAAPAPAVSESHDTVFPGVQGTPAMSASVAENRALLAAATVPSRSATRDLIVATAAQHGVDPKLALAILMHESGWNQRNVSGVNAVGAMQVIPAGGQWASSLLGRQLNLLDTRDNVTAGVVMIRALGKMTTSEDELIAAYYQGLHSVRTKGWYDDTHFYVRTIHALKGRI